MVCAEDNRVCPALTFLGELTCRPSRGSVPENPGLTGRLRWACLPPVFLAPSPRRITVKDGLVYVEGEEDTPFDLSLNEPPTSLRTTSRPRSPSVASPLLIRVGAGDPSADGVIAEVETDARGRYSLPLADGSYDIIVKAKLLSPGVVPPDPVRVSVAVIADAMAVPSRTAPNSSCPLPAKSGQSVSSALPVFWFSLDRCRVLGCIHSPECECPVPPERVECREGRCSFDF